MFVGIKHHFALAGLERNGRDFVGKNASVELDLLLEDFRINPNRYVHVSLFGKKDRLPKLSDSDIDRINRSMQEKAKP